MYKLYQYPNLTTRGISNVAKYVNTSGGSSGGDGGYGGYGGGGSSSRPTYEIITPTVVKMARRHYNCSSMEGVKLEASGGRGSAGAHWEVSEVGNDYMTP